MERVELFYGFPLSSEFEQKLSQVNPDIRSFFIKNHPDYLKKIQEKNQIYLGKTVGEEIDLETLTLIQNNIFSLLKKIVPDFTYTTDTLILFPTYLTDSE